MPIQPSTLNHRLTTPNKLFEAMAAGVPVVASDLPGMADIVRETGCGPAVRPDRTRGDRGAIRVAPRRARRRAVDVYAGRALAAAHGRYNWEAQDGAPARPRTARSPGGRGDHSAPRRRAVLLVANSAAPYSRGLRVARSLVEAGWDVEIAAVAGDQPPGGA